MRISDSTPSLAGLERRPASGIDGSVRPSVAYKPIRSPVPLRSPAFLSLPPPIAASLLCSATRTGNRRALFSFSVSPPCLLFLFACERNKQHATRRLRRLGKMAIDHESPFKELRLKNRRIMGGGGPEPEDEAAAGARGEEWPRWLLPLLSARFFSHCGTHADSHRSGECNQFCLDCSAAGALCSLCIARGHRDHHTIQIRRSSYHDVIRVSDIQRFLDIAGVQTYVINSARVIFLNERPQQHKSGGGGGKAAAASANLCEVCARSLLDNFRFCSLGCKVVGCSPDPVKARNRLRYHSADGSSSSSLRNAADKSFTPPTKRRKGIPHRAPFGSLIVEY